MEIYFLTIKTGKRLDAEYFGLLIIDVHIMCLIQAHHNINPQLSKFKLFLFFLEVISDPFFHMYTI